MSKSTKNRDRRALVEQMRRDARAAERRRTLTVVAICVVVALIIVGLAGWQIWQNQQEKDELAAVDLTDIGVPAAQAGCTSIQQKDATGAGDHVTSKVTYDTVPPSYGAHNPDPVESGHHFFTTDDRPEVERLVHNEEHGWTLVWYDETVANDTDKMDELRAAADKFDVHGNDPRYNMMIVPWTKDDGEGRPIPDGKHVAFTHWSVHQPTYNQDFFQGDFDSFGESQYCEAFSGAALQDFMKKYPYDDSPEGYRWHQ